MFLMVGGNKTMQLYTFDVYPEKSLFLLYNMCFEYYVLSDLIILLLANTF